MNQGRLKRRRLYLDLGNMTEGLGTLISIHNCECRASKFVLKLVANAL